MPNAFRHSKIRYFVPIVPIRTYRTGSIHSKRRPREIQSVSVASRLEASSKAVRLVDRRETGFSPIASGLIVARHFHWLLERRFNERARKKESASSAAPSRENFHRNPRANTSTVERYLPACLLACPPLAEKTAALRRFDFAHRQKPKLLARSEKKAVQHLSIYLSIFALYFRKPVACYFGSSRILRFFFLLLLFLLRRRPVRRATRILLATTSTGQQPFAMNTLLAYGASSI